MISRQTSFPQIFEFSTFLPQVFPQERFFLVHEIKGVIKVFHFSTSPTNTTILIYNIFSYEK